MTVDEVKIGFIGFGNMAGAIAEGLISQGVVPAERMFACAGHLDTLKEKCAAMGGVHACADASSVAANADIVFLAVKPAMLETVVKPVKEALCGKIVVSVAAGYDHARFLSEGILTEDTHLICTCPNTPVSIGKGIFIMENKHSLTEAEATLLKELLSPVSLVLFMDTKLLGIGGTVSGCSPAFVAMFIEALSDAAVMYGIPRKIAYQIVEKMMEGTAAMALATEQHPGQMKDAVASPGGTTIRGIASLEEHNFRGAVIDAIKAIEE